MSDQPYIPFGLSDVEGEKYLALRDSLGNAVRQQVSAWLLKRMQDRRYPDSYADEDLCRHIQTALDVWLGAGARNDVAKSKLLNHLDALSDMDLLRVVDLILVLKVDAPSEPLETALRLGRVKWRVGQRDGRRGLEERVPLGVQEVADDVRSRAGAGQVLSRAWAAVHGLEANPSAAYADAVKAVEIAATTAVQPANASATLGTVIGQMVADGDWRLPLREATNARSAGLVLSMLRTIWVGHRDRHGTADYSDATLEEARTAVTLAVSLVDWFGTGAIARRGDDPPA